MSILKFLIRIWILNKAFLLVMSGVLLVLLGHLIESNIHIPQELLMYFKHGTLLINIVIFGFLFYYGIVDHGARIYYAVRYYTYKLLIIELFMFTSLCASFILTSESYVLGNDIETIIWDAGINSVIYSYFLGLLLGLIVVSIKILSKK